MDAEKNPFAATDAARSEIWEMLVSRDISAFLAADWSMVEGDFIEDEFLGVDGRKAQNPDSWTISFPSLAAYRQEWLRQAAETKATIYAEDVRGAIFRATSLEQIDIFADRAIAHKKFNGSIARADGGIDSLLWQSLYFCRHSGGRWKLSGFIGYLPNPLSVG
jgi:hypothetical protein